MSGQGVSGSARAAHLWYKVAQTGGRPSPPALASRIGATGRGAQPGVLRESAGKGDRMQIPVEPLFTLIMGILILLVPRLLNYFVAIYLIIIGLLGLLNKVYL